MPYDKGGWIVCMRCDQQVRRSKSVLRVYMDKHICVPKCMGTCPDDAIEVMEVTLCKHCSRAWALDSK
jgi:ferredoxin